MGFLAVDTLWFWIALAVASVFFVVATETGSGVGATLTLLISLSVFYFFGDKTQNNSLLSYCSHHAWTTILIALAYIAVGVGWSILKWYSFLIKERNKTKEKIKEYSRIGTPISVSHYDIPKVSDHKSRILVWMFYWPFSALWTLVDEPVRKTYLFIYRHIASYLQNMANKIFASLTEDSRKAEQERLAEIEHRRVERSNGGNR